MPIRVVVIEDDPQLRQTLVSLVERSPQLRCVEAFGSGEEVIRGWPRAMVDVVLMDLRLPGMSGVQVLTWIKSNYPEVRVLSFTQFADETMVLEAVRAGADGYALKRAGLGQLEAGIHAVHRGEGFFPPSIARKMAGLLRDLPISVVVPNGEVERLTSQEQRILHLAKHGLDNKAIANELGCTYATVRTHFDHIRAKLAVRSRARAVAKFFGL